MNAELKITGRLAEVGNLDGGSTPGASIYAGDGRYIEVHNLSEDEASAIAPAFGEMVTVSIALAERTTAPVSLTDEQIIQRVESHINTDPDCFDLQDGDYAYWIKQSEMIKFARALLTAAPAPIQQDPQATLICPTCGKDRFKEPCPNMADECPMIADAHSATPSPSLAVRDVVADDLAMLVRRLVRSLEKSNPGTDLAPQALDYLKRKGLQGSPLRDEKPNADCSGDPANCPDNEGHGCACDPMNKAAKGGAA